MDYAVSCNSSLLIFVVVLPFDYTMSFITTDGGGNTLFMLFFQKVLLGTGAVAWSFRALTSLPEDPGVISSIHTVAHKHLLFKSQGF